MTEVEGVTTNLPFLRWLVSHPGLRLGELTTAFLVENPPLSRPRRPARRPWAGSFRLNLPPPPPCAPPSLEEVSRLRRSDALTEIAAPMPGTVIRVLVSKGDTVAALQPLLVIEAMKMEVPLVAPFAAVVLRLRAVSGDRVESGQLLIELADEGGGVASEGGPSSC